jgi:hypothetical protein
MEAFARKAARVSNNAIPAIQKRSGNSCSDAL